MAKDKEESAGFADTIQAILRDKNGKIKAIRTTELDGKDILVNTGLAQIAGLLLTDIGGTAFDYIGIGIGTVSPAVTDTDLGSSKKRKAAGKT